MALCALCLLLLCHAAAAQQPAPEDELVSGGIVFKVHAGYGNTDYSFALPVPNGALARQGASNTGLAWQLAYNQSVLPVQVYIYHRFPSAFKGRVEVECRNSVSLAEAGGNPVLTISRDLLVPPGVEQQIILLPRVVPPVSPGSPVWLTVRLYQGDNEKPVSVERTYAYQLAPDFLYSLHLDAPDEIVADDINPGNERGLALRVGIPNYGMQDVSAQLLSMRHFSLPAPHAQITGAPLAARDFAFVIADLSQVLLWSAEEQAGLESYLTSGGHLLLYNTGTQSSWRGRPLSRPGAAGRGILLPVQGGFDAAREALRRWLSGELEEFVLLAGGSVGGFAFNELDLPSDQRLSGQLNLASLLGLYRPRRFQPPMVDNPAQAYSQPGWPPYEAGYLNPVYVYRESCRCAAREPWDFPQYSRPNSRYLANSYFNFVVQNAEDGLRSSPPPPLSQLARMQRRIPWPLALGGLPLVLLAAFSLPLRQRALRSALVVLLLLSLGACVWLWLQQRPQPALAVRLDLLDIDRGSSGAVRRSLYASSRSGQADEQIALPPDALLRRLAQSPAGNLRWNTSRPEGWREAQSDLQVSGGGEYLACSYEVHEPASELAGAIKVQSTRSGELLRLALDTSAIDSAAGCFLQTPLGWQLVPAGVQDFKVELRLPRLDPWPGPQRLRQWQQLWRSRSSGWARQLEMNSIGEQSRIMLALQGKLAGGDEELKRLAWLGVVAQPLSGLAAAELASGSGQGLLWVALPEKTSPADPERQLSFIRYSFNLEPGL
ncbi:hypothetical protein IT575_13235 [bacterium]|nr:hypothetical protein [bacterium]